MFQIIKQALNITISQNLSLMLPVSHLNSSKHDLRHNMNTVSALYLTINLYFIIS